jgi:hypothetical protein
MESVLIAAKSIFLKLSAACANRLRRWSLKTLRNVIDRADEWCHELEVRLRDEAAKPAYAAEVDPAASAARERSIKKLGGVSAGKSITGSSASPHSRVLGPHRLPRLKYQHGEFVRS